jgi:DNA-binding FadR family transcriptional regulator
MTSFQRVRRRKIHEDVASQLEEAIATGTFAPGDQLPSERDLMEAFNVGRPAVREALLLLDRMGLVQLSTGERARVTRPTVHGLVDQLSGAARHFLASPGGEEAFQDARRVFEAAIARNAAETAAPADIARLEAALAANRAAAGDVAEFERTDIAFHQALVETGGNPIFAALYRALSGWLARQRTISLRTPGALAAALASHEEIFEAVRARDPEAAGRAMDRHLRQVMGFYRAAGKAQM